MPGMPGAKKPKGGPRKPGNMGKAKETFKADENVVKEEL